MPNRAFQMRLDILLHMGTLFIIHFSFCVLRNIFRSGLFIEQCPVPLLDRGQVGRCACVIIYIYPFDLCHKLS